MMTPFVDPENKVYWLEIEDGDPQTINNTINELKLKQTTPEYVEALQSNDLNYLKDTLKNKINTRRDADANKSVTYRGKRYQARPEDVQRLTSAVSLYLAMGTQAPEKVRWISEDNEINELTVDDLINIGILIAQQTDRAFIEAREAKNAISKVQNAEQLKSLV